jgi:uncharacterized protein YndB with AHSA1/START domain
MSATPDPDLDLTMSRVIKARRADVWNAWTDRERFELVERQGAAQ